MQRLASRRHLTPTIVAVLLAATLAACGRATPTMPPPAATAAMGGATTPAASPTATPIPEAATPTSPRPGPATPGTSGAGTPTAATPVPTASAAPPLPTAVPRAGLPVRVRIPKIRVDADVEYVGLAPDGAMDVPKDYDNTAWYQLGPRPGERGNAAIAGHVDSKTGPAVFWNLSKLRAGDEIVVVGDDGVERAFVVRAVESFKRADAPLDRIFGPADASYLNLITCDPASTFNRATGEYAANIVVFAELAP